MFDQGEIIAAGEGEGLGKAGNDAQPCSQLCACRHLPCPDLHLTDLHLTPSPACLPARLPLFLLPQTTPGASWRGTKRCGCRRCRWRSSQTATCRLCSARPGSERAPERLGAWTVCLLPPPLLVLLLQKQAHGVRAASPLLAVRPSGTPRRRHGYWPMVIHATFQRYPSHGKKERMREFGLWYMDPPEYYGAGTAGAAGGGGTALTAAGAAGGGAAAGGLRFLAYDNGVVQWVAEMERRRYGARGARMPLLEKHWLAMSYQLMAFRRARAGWRRAAATVDGCAAGFQSQLDAWVGASSCVRRQELSGSRPSRAQAWLLPGCRDALATAQILGRTLVFPQIWCWCDFDEHPLILESCRIRWVVPGGGSLPGGVHTSKAACSMHVDSCADFFA